jgi:hypothetical protein
MNNQQRGGRFLFTLFLSSALQPTWQLFAGIFGPGAVTPTLFFCEMPNADIAIQQTMRDAGYIMPALIF